MGQRFLGADLGGKSLGGLRRGIAFVAALGMLTSFGGCAPKEVATSDGTVLQDLGNRVVFDGPILIVPGTRWASTQDGAAASGTVDPGDNPGAWVFRSFARLLCEVHTTPETPLELRLRPDAATADFRFIVQWNDDVLDPETIERQGRDFTLVIPPEKLTPGLHQLVLRRRHPPGTRMDQVVHDNVFERLAWSLDGAETSLELADRPRSRLVAEFLLHGVVGDGTEQRSGVLFDAPRRHAMTVGEAAGRLSLEPANLASVDARFTVWGAGDEPLAQVEVPAGDRRPLELAQVSGPTLELQVESLEDGGANPGPFLWGAPALRRPRGERPARPPIILVTLDTTRRDALDPYRESSPNPLVQDLEVTPRIADWAQQATVFEQAFSTSPWTLPSHASIFTGLYPSRHRAGTRDVQLPTGSVTLAGLLREQGYLTFGISAGELSSSRFGLAQGFHRYRNPDQFETKGDRVDTLVGELLEHTEDTPFFLWINYFDPHALYQAPKRYDEQFDVATYQAGLDPEGGWADLARGKMASWRSAVEGDLAVTPAATEYLRAAYLAEVAWTDHLVGRLFDRLEDLGILDDALVIITADHGELLGEGGYVSHGARLDPELVEIPMIIRWPGQTEGARDRRLVSLVDLFPTILAAAGVEAPASDGHLLVPGDETALRRFAVLEEHEFLVHPLPRFMKVARSLYGVQRSEHRTLVWEAGDECARLGRDGWHSEPCETPREQVLSSLEELLGAAADDPATEGSALSDAEREGLEALGYL